MAGSGEGGIRILNLGSRYPGWIDSVKEQIEEEILVWRKWSAAAPSIADDALSGRAGSLKYFCLVDDLTLQWSRGRLRPEERGHDPDLQELLARMLDAPPAEDGGEQELRPDLEEKAYPSIQVAAHEPRHGIEEDGTSVTVDCYGIYTGSLLGWMHSMDFRSLGNVATEWAMSVNSGEEEDAPAVLVSPELIGTLPALISYTAPSNVRRVLGSDAESLFLKLVLLHEIGHHVYPAHENSTLAVSEAMANWFAFGFLSVAERAVFWEMSSTQAPPYRMYDGLLSLLHGPNAARPWLAAAPWGASHGGGPVSFLEAAAFDRILGDSDALAASGYHEQVNDIAEDARIWNRLARSAELQPLLRSMHIHEGLHPARVRAWILLSEAVPGPGGELGQAMADLEHAGAGPWRAMPDDFQRAWRESAW